MELKNVARYYPEDMPYGETVQYFQSEDGKDFYESISLFTRKYKLCIEPDTGVIRSIAEDVSTLYPAGFTVVETNYLPADCDIYGGWMYENEVVKAVPVGYKEKSEGIRENRLSEANDITKDWRTELQLGLISDDDKTNLILWMAYIKELKTLDLSSIVDEDSFNAIIWPDVPSDVA
jgi:hypothetical protein